ncbi:MAG TPA: hypothetical protein VFQ53_08880 [Kofleriaceae bacterium]|nr:hypothetical protein [Kofleriaceae bacterium]
MRRLQVVAAVIAASVAAPPVAYPCGNVVELTRDEAIRLVARAEKALEAGQLTRAGSLLGRTRIRDDKLAARAMDVRKLVWMRTRTHRVDETNGPIMVAYFKRRVAEVGQADVRFQAWLAEAYVAAGDDAAARAILVDLKRRDLMPDGYAYLTLAALGDGEDRAVALRACEARVRHTSACALPGKVTTKR